jgi:hypothetical protein
MEKRTFFYYSERLPNQGGYMKLYQLNPFSSYYIPETSMRQGAKRAWFWYLTSCVAYWVFILYLCLSVWGTRLLNEEEKLIASSVSSYLTCLQLIACDQRYAWPFFGDPAMILVAKIGKGSTLIYTLCAHIFIVTCLLSHHPLRDLTKYFIVIALLIAIAILFFGALVWRNWEYKRHRKLGRY